MKVFSSAQLQDLRDLQEACQERSIDVVIIGAMAYRLFIEDVYRETADIDLEFAVDMEDLPAFYRMLEGVKWRQTERSEQRWETTRHMWIDVLPAGPALRARGAMEWPRSGLVMSLAGFEHVFHDAIVVNLAPGLTFKVLPPAVLALVKMASYLDDPHGREKDLLDVQRLWRLYEHESERIFAKDVFEARLTDIEFAGAFLLGLDLREIATVQDLQLIDRFLSQVESSLADVPALDLEGRDTERSRQQIIAFRRGLGY